MKNNSTASCGGGKNAAVPENSVKKKFTIALAGNPNCGKTTVFNALTRSREHVGNYSGVTVERTVGRYRIKDIAVEVIDLPGIYSLSGSSPEEKVAMDELLKGGIDLILNIVDAGNLQRNLYLTAQLMELGLPMVIAFNMFDDAKKKGMKFNYPLLEHYFNAPIARVIGSQNFGIDNLNSKIYKALTSPPEAPGKMPHYGGIADEAINAISNEISSACASFTAVPPRYFAIKLLENDPVISKMPAFSEVLPTVKLYQERMAQHYRLSSKTAVADLRYGIIAGACREAITISNEKRRQLSENIDKVVLNRVLGLPIFFLIMLLIFFLTFTCAEPFMEALEKLFELLAEAVRNYWPATLPGYLRNLLADGIIGGVGSVLVFLPNIMILFLCIAFLETTGYMSRAAFVMDGFMHKFGLHGKSFIPMLLGFGCTVPAVMATRTIESKRDRLTTIMVLPLLSCGARLPIYTMIIPAFFPKRFQALTLWGIYLIGLALSLLLARLLKSTLFRGEDEIYVMELPPYRMPTWRNLLLYMYERLMMYLKKAGTVILFASVILYFFNTFPQIPSADATPGEQLEYSIAGRIGKGLEKVTKPIGFDWKISSALVGAVAGKELFVSQLGILYSGDEAALGRTLRKVYSPLQGFCIMLFCLISMPCIATMAVVRRETNSWPLTILQICGLTLLAYAVTLVVYQAGMFIMRL